MAYELEVRGRSADVERETFEHVIEQCVLADEIGYRSVWFVEHHFTRGFSHSSAPETMLAALSRITSRIRLGHGVVLLPFEHPVRVAERVATLDVLSGGRVEFGTGRGRVAHRVPGVPATVRAEPGDLGGEPRRGARDLGGRHRADHPRRSLLLRSRRLGAAAPVAEAATRRSGWRRRRWTASAPPLAAASTCCACRS